jgi:hypothetical protein
MRSSKFSGLAFVPIIVLVVGCLLAGCGDDDGASKPKVITVADLAGTWVATQYKVSTKTVPEVSMDLVAIGGAFSWDADNTGDFTGEMTIPEALGGPYDVPFAGSYELVGQDSLVVEFNPEVPPLLTDSRMGFSLTGNTVTVTDDTGTFDFDQDGTEEPAKFKGILVRS